MRNNNINNAGLGVGYGLGPETIVGQNPHAYNVSWHKYQGHWISNDFKIGGPHVMTRVKTIHMFLDFFKGVTEVPVSYPVRHELAQRHYDIRLNHPAVQKELHYEEFDYDIIKPDLNPFADTLVNEMWPFFRNLWRARGGYTAEVRFHPDLDLKEFGTQYGPGQYWATYKFTITDEGQWEADFDIKFKQVDNPYDDRLPPPEGRKGPFYAQDYSRIQANTAKRARKMAKTTWDSEEGRSGQDFSDLLDEEAELNATIDFSFDYHYKGTGDWSNYMDHVVTLEEKELKRDKSRDLAMPEKEADTMAKKVQSSVVSISLDSIKKKPAPLLP